MMEMKENVMTKIDFITAAGGGIRMYAGDNLKGWGGTAKGIAYTLKTVGLAESVMGSSSMDFASEFVQIGSVRAENHAFEVRSVHQNHHIVSKVLHKLRILVEKADTAGN